MLRGGVDCLGDGGYAAHYQREKRGSCGCALTHLLGALPVLTRLSLACSGPELYKVLLVLFLLRYLPLKIVMESPSNTHLLSAGAKCAHPHCGLHDYLPFKVYPHTDLL